MTKALKKAFEAASRLPDPDQDELAAAILEELEADERRETAFARSQDALERLATHRTRIVTLVAKSRLPSVTTVREYAEAGLLMAYAPDFFGAGVSAAAQVDKIFKGAKPGELPVEQTTKARLILNLRTAKILGLTIPRSVLARADEIIE